MTDDHINIKVSLNPGADYAQDAAAVARGLIRTAMLMVPEGGVEDQVPALWMAELSDALDYIVNPGDPSTLTRAAAVLSAMAQITLGLADLPDRDPQELEGVLADFESRGVTF